MNYLTLLILMLLLTLIKTFVTNIPDKLFTTNHHNNNSNNKLNQSSSTNREKRFLSLPSSSTLSSVSSSSHHHINNNHHNNHLIDETKLPLLFIGEVDLSKHYNCNNWLEPILIQCQLQYENYLHLQIYKKYNRFLLSTSNSRKYSYNQNDDHNHRKINRFKINRNDEYVKHASCCGMWHARNCVIKFIQININNHNDNKPPDDCPDNLIDLFRNLPNEPLIRESVFDYCSEYSDGSSICHQISSSSSSSLSLSIASFLILFLFL